MTKKNREMLAAFRDESMAARFLDLPEALFKRILKRKSKRLKLRRKDAATLACAFAIALLQIAPVRPKNGAQPLLRKNIIEQGEGASRRVFAHWEPEEVKNEAELHFELTGLTLELFDLYMKHARPLLCALGNNYLFPGRGLGPKDESWFSQQIAEMTQRELGVRVSGQQFRHLTGFLYLLAHPADYETVRQFLGHSTISTTINFYCGMEMRDAAQALDAATAKRRAELAAKARRSLRYRRGG
jgi:integrase